MYGMLCDLSCEERKRDLGLGVLKHLLYVTLLQKCAESRCVAAVKIHMQEGKSLEQQGAGGKDRKDDSEISKTPEFGQKPKYSFKHR